MVVKESESLLVDWAVLYLLRELALRLRPTSRARKLTAHLFSFCMHLRFRLKDPIATLRARRRSAETGRFRRNRRRIIGRLEMGWVMTRSREVLAAEYQLWSWGWTERPRSRFDFNPVSRRTFLTARLEGKWILFD